MVAEKLLPFVPMTWCEVSDSNLALLSIAADIL